MVVDGSGTRLKLRDGGAEFRLHGGLGVLRLRNVLGGGADALTTACVAEVDSRTQAAVELCARPAVLKLRRANGKHKHRRWAHLEHQGAAVILVWAQHEDGSEQWQWKTFGSVPPKRRTVTGVREAMLPPGHANAHRLGFAVETLEGGRK